MERVRTREKSLTFASALGLGLAVFGSYVCISIFNEIFKELSAENPLITRLVTATYVYWWLIPCLLILLFVGLFTPRLGQSNRYLKFQITQRLVVL